MRKAVIIDTGVLVAYLNRREKYHQWTKEKLAQVAPPLMTCEAVIAETCFLLSKTDSGTEKLFELLETGHIIIPFRLEHEIKNIKELMTRYANVPMSLADACLVRMSEQDPDSEVLTLDRDFRIYRKNRRQVIPLIIPE
ncbi:MAG: PIN domain-containing protein [candidate division KSB1 bacterium]|nr:PIN domain-containing protein [candidate division KSB1 bacterium]MDZ7301346.1 PIN domain-containing protein [candidate division KSB1 bacterium]MDZ7310769.1 PIN domain-containing protein [candidate division KSB1 bacterium]